MSYDDNSTYSENRENFATLPASEIGGALWAFRNDYYQYIRDSGFWKLWSGCYEHYYKGYFTRGQSQKRGLAGELTKVNVNHFRNMVLHVVNMITSQRPAFEPRAANSDYRSMSQTEIAKGILDYYMRQEDLELYLKNAAEMAFLLGEGYIILYWDQLRGDDVAPDTEKDNKIIKTGDIAFYNASPVDVIRDYNAKSHDELQWHIVRRFKNKWDLAAQFPEHKEDIISKFYKRDANEDLYSWSVHENTGDKIPVYTFFHKPTPAVPDGRMVEFVDQDIVLTDSPLIGGYYPVKRVSPNEFRDTPFGYSPTFDMLEPQRNYNSLASAITTNQEMFAIQQIAVEKGSSISVEDIGPMKTIYYAAGKRPPEAINFTATPQEVFGRLGDVETEMEKMAGLNSVVRGEPQASLESGSALALVKQTAVEFNNAYEQSYNKLIEHCGDGIIVLTQYFATLPRIALISGKSNKEYLKEYKGSDIDQIERVIVDRGNPMAKTLAGKIQIAQDLMNNGMIKTPEQYVQVIESGTIEPIIEGEQAEMMFIKDENEQLADGVELEVAWTDNHMAHIKEHKVVMASVDARQNPELMSATLKHLDQHLEALRSTDPQQLMILGQQPLQPEMGGQMNPDMLTNNMNMAAQEQPDLPDLPEPAQPPVVGDEQIQ
jgi:hypothetical protein